MTCGELKPPQNGRFVHYPCSNVFNSACGIQCHPGYELKDGSSVRMCLPNGQWSGTQPRWEILQISFMKIRGNLSYSYCLQGHSSETIISSVGLFCFDKFEDNQTRKCSTFFSECHS